MPDILVSQLPALLRSRRRHGGRPVKNHRDKGEGLAALADAIAEHHPYLETWGNSKNRARRRPPPGARDRAGQIVERIRAATPDEEPRRCIQRVAARELDPHSAAEALAAGCTLMTAAAWYHHS